MFGFIVFVGTFEKLEREREREREREIERERFEYYESLDIKINFLSKF